MFDVNAVREQFPALNQDVNQSPLVYLDSAATTQNRIASLMSSAITTARKMPTFTVVATV